MQRLEKISEVWKSWQWSFDLSPFNTTAPDIWVGNRGRAVANQNMIKWFDWVKPQATPKYLTNFEVTVGDTGNPTAPWAQALEKPRAALDAAWHWRCNGHRQQRPLLEEPGQSSWVKIFFY